jgi:hypothetical protein
MRRDLTILASLAGLLAGGAWWWGSEREEDAAGRVVVAAMSADAAAPTAATTPRAIAPAMSPVTLLETETPDETSAGAATVRYPDGYVRRIAVGQQLDRARLTDVTDTSAIFRTGARSIALQVSRDAAPASAATGIDYDAHPTSAKPAMARR